MVRTDDTGVDIDGMIEYLERTPVVFALLFGSHARGTAEWCDPADYLGLLTSDQFP